jgi:hypothetical protein
LLNILAFKMAVFPDTFPDIQHQPPYERIS